MKIKLIPRKLIGTIDAVPSKSHAHRILIAQKIAKIQAQSCEGFSEDAGKAEEKESREVPSFSDDITASKACLAQLDKHKPYLDCGESGSTLRFLLPLVMTMKEKATFLGRGKLPDRPLSPLKEEMERHGCTFTRSSNKNTDRVKEICSVEGKLKPGEYVLAGDVSSQFVSALLFALPLLDGDSRIVLTTKAESEGYIEMTQKVLKEFGIEIIAKTSEEGLHSYEIPGNQTYTEPGDWQLEGDWSNAAFWLAAGAISGEVTVRGLNMDSLQRDKEIIRILGEMGAEIEISDAESEEKIPGEYIQVTARAGNLKGIDIDVAQIPDLAPILSVLMASAERNSTITQCLRLKYKESNRIKSIYSMIYALDGDISYGGDRLAFTGKAFLEGGRVDSRNDHRIAMAATIASCICMNPVILENPLVVNKSYPDFFKDFEALGGELEEVTV